MSSSEIPSGGETPSTQPDEATSPKGEPKNKGKCCQRVYLWTIVTAVALIAIAGVTITTVLETQNRQEKLERNDLKEQPLKFTEGPFTVEPGVFSLNITEQYSSLDELRSDIEALTKTMLNKIILENANEADNWLDGNDDDWGRWNWREPEPCFTDEGGMTICNSPLMIANSRFPDFESDVPMAISAADGGSDRVEGFSSTLRNVNDFGTYQQEAGAVRNDLVKSNGVHVFAASDNRILVWDLEGNLKDTVTDEAAEDRSRFIHIKALLMNPEGTRLVVVNEVSSGQEYIDFPIVRAFSSTLVRVYGIDDGSLTIMSESTLNGYYMDSYIVGTNVHVATTMELSSPKYLEDPLQLWALERENTIETSDEYFAVATRRAEELIPEFVEKVTDLVVEDDKILVSRLTGFDSITNDPVSVIQLSSFNSGLVSDEEMVINVSKTMAIRPTASSHVYATEGWIWVADGFWSRLATVGGFTYKTGLFGFRLDGASSAFAAVGYVPGRLLNQFSIDFVKNDENAKEYVRVATTQDMNQFMEWGWRSWMDDDNDGSRTKNEIVILEVPQQEGSDQEVKELTRMGSIDVGKKNEVITAVRFFDNLSYVVTFEETDPFYVLDLSDPSNPTILGELEIPGFSEFMHPIKEDNSLLITVGRDADQFGTVKGVQISIFDSSKPADPQLVDRFVFNDEANGWSSTSASWDERAFRYFQDGDIGRLILPVSIYSNDWDRFGNKIGDDFEGFMVFTVNVTSTENMIKQDMEVNHWSHWSQQFHDWSRCHCPVYLPERSMVFDGNLMTMKGESVMSTDLVTGENEWRLTFENDTSCCNI